MDERTALVTIPHVSFSPGFVTDVRAISDAAHRHGSLLLVDAAQSVGALGCDVEDLGIDALGVATQKNLLGFYGLGFLYVRRALAESLIPSHVARYGMDLGAEAGETARSGGHRLPYAPGARRFDLGNYNYLGAVAAEASLKVISSIGVDRIERHLRALATRLAEGLLELDLPVAGGSPGPHLGHIVAVGHSGGGHHDTADDPAMNDLYQHLTANGVHLSIRKESSGCPLVFTTTCRMWTAPSSWFARGRRPDQSGATHHEPDDQCSNHGSVLRRARAGPAGARTLRLSVHRERPGARADLRTRTM